MTKKNVKNVNVDDSINGHQPLPNGIARKSSSYFEHKTIEEKMRWVNELKEREGLNNVKDKDLRWYAFPEGFVNATKLPGVPKGFFTIFRGKSNTGKSTAKLHAIIEAQRQGDLPIIYETESNFPWEHARMMGMEYEEVFEEYVNEENGEIEKRVIDHTGFFIFYDNYKLYEKYGNIDHTTGERKKTPTRRTAVIEDIAYSMNEYLDMQLDGRMPMNILFVWDSVGSIISYKSATTKAAHAMYDAAAISSCFKNIVNNRIPSSKKESSQYYATFLAINKVWIDSMQMGGPQVKNSNGEAFYYAARLIIHLGGIMSSSVTKLIATSKNENYQYGIKTKIKVEKNQVNDITYEGNIASTSHGFWDPDKLESYKKKYAKFLLNKLSELSGQIIDDDNIDLTMEEE